MAQGRMVLPPRQSHEDEDEVSDMGVKIGTPVLAEEIRPTGRFSELETMLDPVLDHGQGHGSNSTTGNIADPELEEGDIRIDPHTMSTDAELLDNNGSDGESLPSKRHYKAKATFASKEEALVAKILWILKIYPRISPSMLQTGLGPQYKSEVWRPILDFLVGLNKVCIIQETHISELNRYRTIQVICLPQNVNMTLGDGTVVPHINVDEVVTG